MSDSSMRTTWLHQRLDRWQAGDDKARDEMIRSTIDRLELLARKMLRDFPAVRRTADTGDILQNSVMRLLRALEKVRPDSVRDYYGLAAVQIRRELLDLARRARRTKDDVPITAPESSADSTRLNNDPAAPVEPADLARWTAFHEQVETLPAEEREVVSLVFYHGWTQAEVADLFQVTERTIRRWWQSAMLTLHGRIHASDSIA
jgi:RNA polymerase sigma-70 factor (ECF subfamily)